MNDPDFRARLRSRDRASAGAPRAWPGAVRWFSAEFLVVATGVLVALALNAWWHERQDREREVAYLKQLSADLAATEAELAAAQEFFIEAALASARVTQAFWQPVPPPADSLVQSLWQPLGSRRFRPVLGTIHALVATGDLRLIRSDALRSELMAYLEFAQANIDDIQRHDETYYRPGVNELRASFDPSLLAHLNDLSRPSLQARRQLFPFPAGERRPPFPHGLDALYDNAALYNAYSKLLTAHRNQALHYQRILERARRVQGAVHQHLYGTADPGNCQLEFDGAQFIGGCGVAFASGGELSLSLQQAEENRTEPLLREWPPLLWAGTAGDAGVPRMAVEVEVDLAGRGIVRTESGSYLVRALVWDQEGRRLSFRLDGRAESQAGVMNGRQP